MSAAVGKRMEARSTRATPRCAPAAVRAASSSSMTASVTVVLSSTANELRPRRAMMVAVDVTLAAHAVVTNAPDASSSSSNERSVRNAAPPTLQRRR